MLSRVSQNSDMPPQSSAFNDELATVNHIAELLHVPNSWVYERTRRSGLERMPHFKLGKYLRFSKIEVLEWIQRQRGNSLAPR
jgi:predicted DNA-binding transcriptional regulator AlpA